MQPLYYTIYKITNVINQKIYIGKHQTININDSYMGSGKILRFAIDKYGITNFTKEILHIFDNEAEMNQKEAELVTAEFVLRETNYNLCVGGQGGFSHINATGKSVNTFDDPEIQKKALVKANVAKKELFAHDPKWAAAYSKSLSAAYWRMTSPPTFKGKRHTTASLLLIKEAAKSRTTNSQTGTCWITNGESNQKIKKTDLLPDGWRYGRKIKNTPNKKS
jgi:hypothetical protein